MISILLLHPAPPFIYLLFCSFWPTEFQSGAALLWLWLNTCAGDTRGLHFNPLLGTWMDYSSIQYIKYSLLSGLQFPATYCINWIDCFQAWSLLWFHSAEQFQNRGSRCSLPCLSVETTCWCLARISSYLVAKTPGSDAWRRWWILTCLWMFSQLHLGVTGGFDLLLFVSTLIFISMKEAGCQLSANIKFVFGSWVSKSSSGGLICNKVFFLIFEEYGKKKKKLFFSGQTNGSALTSSSSSL